MNKNKINNIIMLLLVILSVIFSIIVLGYYVDKNFKQEISKGNITYILSEYNISEWDGTYSIFYDSLSSYSNEFNVSHVPYEQFCNDTGMKYFLGNILQSSGCVDIYGEKHYYEYSYKEGYWNIGNKTYKAEWTDEVK